MITYFSLIDLDADFTVAGTSLLYFTTNSWGCQYTSVEMHAFANKLSIKLSFSWCKVHTSNKEACHDNTYVHIGVIQETVTSFKGE